MQNATHCLISVLYLIVYYLTFLCAHYIICHALLFHASEVSKKLLSDYEVVILYHILRILPIMQLIMKMRIYIVTIVEPNGVEVNIDIIIPNTSPNTERIAEYIITDLKLVITLIADRAGNTKRAVITAIIRLYTLVFLPMNV